MKYYLAIKKDEIMPFIATWINLEIITLSKLDKDKYHISVIYGIFKKDTNEFIYKRETQT